MKETSFELHLIVSDLEETSHAPVWESQFLAPKVVIYDHACGLDTYVRNRDPGFFKDTIFLVDRLHYKGHVGELLLIKHI